MRLEVFPEKLLVSRRRIAPAASSGGKETETPVPASLGGDESLECFANGCRDRLVALARDSAQVPLHAFIQENGRAFHMLYASICTAAENSHLAGRQARDFE